MSDYRSSQEVTLFRGLSIAGEMAPDSYVTIEQNRSPDHHAVSFASNPAKIGRWPPEQALLKCSSLIHPAAARAF